MSLATTLATKKAVLLDIEGTTTSINFVYETLFPYARTQLAAFMAQPADEAKEAALVLLSQEYQADLAQGHQPPPWDNGLSYLYWLMDQDRKSTSLKAIQGQIWALGYENGTLKGDLFADVAPALVRWYQAGLILAIFSSGSIQAQKLLFRYSLAGDLTPYLSYHFDTTTGAKIVAESYTKIVQQMGLAAHEVVFISDSLAELAAAQQAGLTVFFSVRPGNPVQTSPDYPIISSFDPSVDS